MTQLRFLQHIGKSAQTGKGRVAILAKDDVAFYTDTSKGQHHGDAEAKGSVFNKPLVSSGYTLWLEHVKGRNQGPQMFWLMWYDAEGTPKIPMSGVMSIEQVRSMTAQLAGFIDLDKRHA